MAVEDARVERRSTRKRSRVSLIGVVGELFITAGVLVLLFLGWQLWLNDLLVGTQQNKQASALSQTWGKSEAVAPPVATRPDPGEPVVGAAPDNAVQFANLIVPRFGADYERPIAEGIGTEDVLQVGVGHYPGTQMPGAVGNVALAAHRTTWGAPFSNIADLQVGDSIYIETEAGWYRYVFRSLEYVQPTGVGVLDAVPQLPSATPTDRLLTMTSCNPKFSAAERFVAYSVFDTWYPRAGGPPAEIAALVIASAAG
ncbi:MAG: class sortase [Rhodoglobus sp.]|nr:class sortase [Rhodoglobus sp.]